MVYTTLKRGFLDMEEYYPRLIDAKLPRYLKAFGATHIQGPKGAGKTTTAEQYAQSALYVRDPATAANIYLTATTIPSCLLQGEKPRLIDEWQLVPWVWDAIRMDCDWSPQRGRYLLTSSFPALPGSTMHSGAGRIAGLVMRPMSLYESKDSTGSVSLDELFSTNEFSPCRTDTGIRDIASLICRGGWPQNINATEKKALQYSRRYLKEIPQDLSLMDDQAVDPIKVGAFLAAYAHHLQEPVKNTILLDQISARAVSLSEPTYHSYLDKLKRLSIIEEIPAWKPAIRSQTAIRRGRKRGFVDPSLAVALLKLTVDGLLKDFAFFERAFESLCLRDLRVYLGDRNGDIHHYRDDYDLSCDAIIKRRAGEYALIQTALSSHRQESAAQHLGRLEALVLQKKRPKPAFKMILTAGEYGYTRLDGIHIVPLACLRD